MMKVSVCRWRAVVRCLTPRQATRLQTVVKRKTMLACSHNSISRPGLTRHSISAVPEGGVFKDPTPPGVFGGIFRQRANGICSALVSRTVQKVKSEVDYQNPAPHAHA